MKTFQSNWKKKIFVAAMAIIAASQASAQAQVNKAKCISGNCQDGYGVYVDEGRVLYFGNFENGQLNGKGNCIYIGDKSIDMYFGNFRDGLRDGEGTYTWGDGSGRYTGYWEEGLRHGLGTTVYADGTTSSDIWVKGEQTSNDVAGSCINGNCYDGDGVYVYQDGSMYEGHFRKGYPDGEGKYSDKDGSVYTGHWQKGYYSGYGELSNPDGTQKNGLWDKGRFSGEVNTTTMQGCISGNCYDGYGVMIYDDASYYLGDFKDGVSSGSGSYYLPDGTSVRGSFSKDQPNGFCIMKYPENDIREKYVGDFSYGKVTGYGALIYKDGSIMYGQFNDGVLNGEGVTYDSEKNEYHSGAFANGEFLAEKSEDQFKLIYGSRDGFGIRLIGRGRYTGQLKNGTPNGQGILQQYSGTTLVGNFVNGDIHGQGTAENRFTGYRYIGEFTEGYMTGNGTMFYPDGTSQTGYFKEGELQSEKVADTKVPKPEVSWTAPQYYNTDVNEGKMTIKLCVESKSPLSEVIVTVNGQIQVKKALSRGFKVVTADCDYPLEYEIELNPGANVIEAVVKNEGGETKTDARTVNYVKSDNVSKQKRVAIVIGNADYQNITKLANSVNDAKLMAETLTNLGFEVYEYENLSKSDMSDRIYDFGDKLKAENAVGLFYYAGHGLQVNGKNYLVPVDAKVERPQQVDDNCVTLDRVLNELETAKNDLNIIILDACRNNPFPEVSRAVGGNGGLAQVNAPKGTFVAYATAPGRTASDGTGNNGLYTEQLAKAINTPGAKLEDVFKVVRNNVYNISKEQGMEQIPWENSSIFGDFYFKQ